MIKTVDSVSSLVYSSKQIAPDNNVMHTKPDLRVLLKWMIYRSGSVITDVIRLKSWPTLNRLNTTQCRCCSPVRTRHWRHYALSSNEAMFQSGTSLVLASLRLSRCESLIHGLTHQIELSSTMFVLTWLDLKLDVVSCYSLTTVCLALWNAICGATMRCQKMPNMIDCSTFTSLTLPALLKLQIAT